MIKLSRFFIYRLKFFDNKYIIFDLLSVFFFFFFTREENTCNSIFKNIYIIPIKYLSWNVSFDRIDRYGSTLRLIRFSETLNVLCISSWTKVNRQWEFRASLNREDRRTVWVQRFHSIHVTPLFLFTPVNSKTISN